MKKSGYNPKRPRVDSAKAFFAGLWTLMGVDVVYLTNLYDKGVIAKDDQVMLQELGIADDKGKVDQAKFEEWARDKGLYTYNAEGKMELSKTRLAQLRREWKEKRAIEQASELRDGIPPMSKLR